ncbi:MAG: NAD(P)/FAD-dependent oxidoreductase [Candidatus Velthaea sp.]
MTASIENASVPERADAKRRTVAIVGGGFSGLSAALELARANVAVTVFEADASVGGLAGSFDVAGFELEKFYHHWFTNDRHVMELIDELDMHDHVLLRESRTGMYFANKIFRLSRPLDLLKFTPLPFIDRIRLGLLMLQARAVKDWRTLETVSARDWLISMCGKNVYRVVWEPLLKGKFGTAAPDISAVWFWNKLVLRGGSRGKGGKEQLAYFRGGFAALAEAMCRRIEAAGGQVLTGTRVTSIEVSGGRATGVVTESGTLAADAVLLTPPLPAIADLLEGHVPAADVAKLRAVRYLANVCLVLNINRSLSDTYWLNVNDASFPFVGLIEHTNFEPPESYGGRHIVYLSKYLPESDALYQMNDTELFEYALPFIKRIVPEFDRSWVNDVYVWRAQFSQPIVVQRYSELIPPVDTALANVHVCSMAQIYPEDRGTNYAIREGRAVGRRIALSC